uniref:Immunoglobulin domain-containing protein n=1 Tax=Ailuropoda melanoleuca TaxID=9646 RepID=G1L998_AILME
GFPDIRLLCSLRLFLPQCPLPKLAPCVPGGYMKPSLSAQPSPAVSPGAEVTLQCRSQYSFDQFALYKEGAAAPQKGSEKQYWADFPITAVTVAHSGTYRCYSFSSKLPYLWSAPSDPLELVVTGERAADQVCLLQLLPLWWKFQGWEVGGDRCGGGGKPGDA